ncbi:GtrA family protein [Eubacteriales bacterium OttesenSCG-928-N14]|nr:GtrA family protein [Eubacteriales bacterium OttesenSCG-928-N14]
MIKRLWNMQPVRYILFGGLTTLMNILVYAAASRLLGTGVTTSTAIAWLLAVVFAYVTNRMFVFQSKASGVAILKEAVLFFGGRLLSGLLDIGIMALFVDVLGMNDILIKVLSNVLVMIFNYILSKFIIFQDKKV